MSMVCQREIRYVPSVLTAVTSMPRAPSRQEGCFEVMVGKNLSRAGTGQVFAFVHRLEPKPTDRMELFLAEQGVFPAKPTTFLSDGGERVRQAQGEFREFGEPILDWFHVAMRMTQLSQALKGLAPDPPVEGDSPNRIEDIYENGAAPRSHPFGAMPLSAWIRLAPIVGYSFCHDIHRPRRRSRGRR